MSNNPYNNKVVEVLVGTRGPQGPTGADSTVPGPIGPVSGEQENFTLSESTVENEPDSGTIRFNNASIALATEVYIHDLNANADNVRAWLISLDDSNNATPAVLEFRRADSITNKARFFLTSITLEDNYIKLAVTFINSSGSLNTGVGNLAMVVSRTGDKGDLGNTGLSAYQSWINEGNEGNEEVFLEDIGGASAYQSWLNVGNFGSEQDFIDSLSPFNPIKEIDSPIKAIMKPKTYHAFGFDRMVEGFTGNSVRLKKLDLMAEPEEDFTFSDESGVFNLEAVHTWREGFDVNIAKFYDHMGTSAEGLPIDDITFIVNGKVSRQGSKYEETFAPEQDITNITKATNAVVTVPNHNYVTGDGIYIGLVNGMFEINGYFTKITVIDDDTFSLDDIDSTSYSDYIDGGYVEKQQQGLLYRSSNYGGVGCNTNGTGAIRFTNTTVPVSGNGLNLYMLASLNSRKQKLAAGDILGGNKDNEVLFSYGTGNNNDLKYQFFSTFGTYSYFGTTNGSAPNQIVGANNPWKKYGQFVHSVHIKDTSYHHYCNSINVRNTNYNNANMETDISNGVIDDADFVVAGGFSNSSGDIQTTQRSDMLFSGLLMTENVTAFENTMVTAKLGAIGQQHRVRTLEWVRSLWDALVIHENVDPTDGTVEDIHGRLTLDYYEGANTTVDFEYTDPEVGLQGVNIPDQDPDNGFRATDNYFAGVTTGTVFGLHKADLVSGQLAYIFTQGTEDGRSSSNVNRSLALGRDHSNPTFWATVATSRDPNLVTGSRSFTDGTPVVDSLGNQEMVKYSRNTAHTTVNINRVAHGYNHWTLDSVANRDPNATKTMDAPTGFCTPVNMAYTQSYNGHLQMHVATFKAPVGYDRADDLATREPLMFSAENRSYVFTAGTAIGHVQGDIAINRNACPVDSTDDARIISSHWFNTHEGTTFAIGFLPNVALNRVAIEEFMISYYKLWDV